jgi:YVTN family beta-propeller protein
MQNDGKIQRRLIFLIILSIIILLVVVVLSNFTYAQEKQDLHQKTLDEITKPLSSKEIPHITVGKGPMDMAISYFYDKAYIANFFDGTVSVIDTKTNKRIEPDIKVGSEPIAIHYSNNNGKIYVANARSGTVSVIATKTDKKIEPDIKVGSDPEFMAEDSKGKIFVVNVGNNSVSVINGKTDKKIEPDIKVGRNPAAIAVSIGDFRGIYVANSGNGTVSVIDANTSKKIEPDIKVGSEPIAIAGTAVIGGYAKIYVANSGNGTVSVIDGKTDKRIEPDMKVASGPINLYGLRYSDKKYVAKYDNGNFIISVIDANTSKRIEPDIKVGSEPIAISVDEDKNTIYVATTGEKNDGAVYVIDSEAHKVVAKVKFNTEPFNAGHIQCDTGKLPAPIAQEFYIWSGSKCTAKPNQGFEFVSWQENLNGNSTQLLNVSSAPSVSDSILDFLHMKPDKPEATLGITKFGNFTANFKALPPPIPPEYVATLFTVVATALVGSWLTPTIIGWRKAKKQGSKLDHYHNEVKNLYNDVRLSRKDINEIDILRDNITDEYTRGKINKEQYDRLGEEISKSYREIFTKKIDSLNNLFENDKVKQLSDIKRNIEDAHNEGKINNEYYTNLKKEISILYEEIFKKRIDSLNNLPENDKVKLLDEMKDDISDAYSKEKISELHYTLLKEKLSNYEKK